MHDGADTLRHTLQRRSVTDIGDDSLFVVGQVLHRSDIRKTQVTPLGA